MAVLEKAPTPPLQAGDVLSRAEFERRYAAMPELKKAELIDGIVYMAPPVRAEHHGIPHVNLATLLQVYAARYADLKVADNSTVRLDMLNEPQPDLLLMRDGGQARIDLDGYICGAPELVAEIASSSASYDLHQKKRTYLRSGALEYLVWIVAEKRIVWWQLQGDDFVEIQPAADGSLESPNFPGLVIDAPALVAGDFAKALARVA
ncbi:Uma2 family endonuclease [Luteolibacter arcticus]|uniref:Uma2 family endonuclease n=1 Tax=Luteolibacter arcticus TaxID=1581411 RepID=A0ABT3GIY0_9BACT|nr:Uma2 family endonuclease [Luteolibacter arcticus]MCW1923459.1 Uma2 family endonuclease [Luteolibacter arcticus]